MTRVLLLSVTAALALALGGCAAADKNAAATSPNSGSSSMSSGMSMSGSGSGSGSGNAGSVVSSGSSMSGMNGNTATVVNAKGVPTPVPVRTIGSGDWHAMKITAQEMTPVPFWIDNGTSFREDKPPKGTSFHLMVMLTDRKTGVAIPYASVWASITKRGKTVFNEPQWPMLSEYMGPHYGNNVTLPGSGTYKLTLLVSAPVAAVHKEYAKMWIGTHKVTSTFTWK